jgi:hypothetical protein
VDWTQRSPQHAPSSRDHAGAVFQSHRNRDVRFGGNRVVGPTEWDEAWVYGVLSSFRSFGGGCAGWAGLATLSARLAVPRIGQPFTVFATNLPPDHAALMFLGVSNRMWRGFSLPLQLDAFGMPGCRLFVSTELASPLFNWGGNATWMALIPNDMSLAGRSFYMQALAIDRVANPLGAVMSNTMAGVIGV